MAAGAVLGATLIAGCGSARPEAEQPGGAAPTRAAPVATSPATSVPSITEQARERCRVGQVDYPFHGVEFAGTGAREACADLVQAEGQAGEYWRPIHGRPSQGNEVTCGLVSQGSSGTTLIQIVYGIPSRCARQIGAGWTDVTDKVPK